MSDDTPTVSIVDAAAAFLETIDNLTTHEFALGGDQFTREQLRRALAAVKP